jgi:hypothetical protein
MYSGLDWDFDTIASTNKQLVDTSRGYEWSCDSLKLIPSNF